MSAASKKTGQEEETSGNDAAEKSRPRRRAAKNVSNSAYLVDSREDGSDAAVDSPVSEGEVRGVAKGRGRGTKRKLGSLKVPPLKIKLIGRSDDNDSPIFFAQSLEEVRLVGMETLYYLQHYREKGLNMAAHPEARKVKRRSV